MGTSRYERDAVRQARDWRRRQVLIYLALQIVSRWYSVPKCRHPNACKSATSIGTIAWRHWDKQSYNELHGRTLNEALQIIHWDPSRGCCCVLPFHVACKRHHHHNHWQLQCCTRGLRGNKTGNGLHLGSLYSHQQQLALQSTVLPSRSLSSIKSSWGSSWSAKRDWFGLSLKDWLSL